MKQADATIQGLRGLAIIAIIFYFAKINYLESYFLPGGFLGIDIFFIIAGYFIGLKLFANKSKNHLNKLINFFNEKLRRLVPALMFMTFATYIFFVNIFAPKQLLDYSDSLIISNLFLSNYYFNYLEIFFGQRSSLLIPFFHTSSISILFQGCIIFILIYFTSLFVKKDNYLIYFVILLIFFTTISQYFLNYKPNLFYVDVLSRMWELIFGTIIYLLDKKKLFNNFGDFSKNIIIFISFFLIIFSFFKVDVNSLKYSYQIFPFVISIGLIILLRNSDNFLLFSLENKYLKFIGDISYSLYLWHFSFFAYLRLDWIENLSLINKITFSILILLISIFSYLFIEKPFRNKKFLLFRNFYAFVFGLFVLIFIQNSIISKNSGFYNNFIVGDTEISNSLQKKLLSDKFIQKSFGSNFKDKIIIIGDSQGKDTYNSFFFNKDLFTKYNFIYLNTDIGKFNEKYKKDKKFEIDINQSKWIVISSRWNENNYKELKLILNKFGEKIILFGQAPEFPENIIKFKKKYTIPEVTLFKNFIINKGSNISDNQIKNLEKIYFKNLYMYDPSINKIALKIKDLANEKKIIFIDKANHLCNFDEKTCEFLVPKSNYEILYNNSRFSREGAMYIGKKYYISLKKILYD